ncbi:hypothetical protein [Nocardia asiatica]|uniref:hypothetical protein n=1 Tax=Nocardia asiatica TaxID=209252 RepID=UPI002454B47A|nr:hypothetical protein [Nocardia asiatica]
MSQPSRIDTAELHAMVSTLERLIAEAARTVGELKATIASAEAKVSGDRREQRDEPLVPARTDTAVTHEHAAQPLVSARTDTAVTHERTAASMAEPGRVAMPTPWSRRPPATPWSRRVVRPCPTVPSAPVRVAAPRVTGVPIAELAPPTRQPAVPRHSDFGFSGGRTGADESVSVRRTDDDSPSTPQVAVTADAPPIRRSERADEPALALRADAAAIRPIDVIEDSSPIRRTGAAPIPQSDDSLAKTDTAPRSEPVPPTTHGLLSVQRNTAVPVEESGIRPVQETEHATAPPADTEHPRPNDARAGVPQANTGQLDTADDSPSVPEIDIAQEDEPVPPIDTVAEPVALERSDTANSASPRPADSPPRVGNSHRPELISPLDLANCLASVQRTVPRSPESAASWRPASTHDSALSQQLEAADDRAADGKTAHPAAAQRADPGSTGSATPWGTAPVREPETLHDSALVEGTAAVQQTDHPRPSAAAQPMDSPIQQGDFADGPALGPRSEASSRLSSNQHSATRDDPGRIDPAADPVPSDTATGSASSPWIGISHRRDATPPIADSKDTGEANRNDRRPHPRISGTGLFTPTPRTDPVDQGDALDHRAPVRRTADPAARPSDRQATAAPRDRAPDSAPGHRPAPALGERGDAGHRPPQKPQTGTTNASEVSRIAQEMSQRHGVKIVGFGATDIDVQAVREIVSAVDDLLAKYPIPLRGVELTDDPESRPRPNPTTVTEDSPEVWLILAKPAPHPPGGAAEQQTRRIFRRRGPVERPVYTTVVREFARALDVAGGFRARQEALRTLINESLLRGGSGAGLLDPGRALVEGFTEVVLRGDRAGASAKELHAALVKMARAESTDLPEATDPPEATDLPGSTDLSA